MVIENEAQLWDDIRVLAREGARAREINRGPSGELDHDGAVTAVVREALKMPDERAVWALASIAINVERGGVDFDDLHARASAKLIHLAESKGIWQVP